MQLCSLVPQYVILSQLLNINKNNFKKSHLPKEQRGTRRLTLTGMCITVYHDSQFLSIAFGTSILLDIDVSKASLSERLKVSRHFS